jgi:iron complex transport system ATP-binding protein
VTVRRGRREVLQSVDLSLRTGEFVGVVGPNGAGKSTLLHVLAAMQPPSSGRGVLFGEALPLKHRVARSAWSRLAFLPQRHETAPELPFTVRDVVEFGRAGLAADGGSSVRDALRLMELQDFADRLYRDLSGGEQQKVQLARLWARRADLVLLDEPAAGLDPDRRERLTECVTQLAGARRTVVMVTHDIHDLPVTCSRVLLIRAGRLVGDGPPARVLTDAALSALYDCRMHVTHHAGRYAAFSVGRGAGGAEQ